MDNDAMMLDVLGKSLLDLQTKFRMASIEEQMTLRQPLQQALDNYATYQGKLLNDGIITTGADLDQANDIAAGIDAAADRQSFLVVLGRVIAFIAPKI
jgi:hypothetical protein